MSESIVPFADAATKRVHDAKKANAAILERIQGVPANVEPDGGNPNIDAIENILKAMEGMEAQIHALIGIAQDQDARIQALEKAGKSKIIKVTP